MPTDRRRVLAAGLAGAAYLAAPAIARGATRTLATSSWLPPAHVVPKFVIASWAEAVGRASDGRLAVDLLDKPLGPPPAHLEIAREGRADMVYSLHGYSGPSAFQRARIGQFSFLGDSFGASPAFSQVYGQDLNAADEHDGIKLLTLFQHGPGVLFLKSRRLERASDLNGLRIRTSGGYIAQLMQRFGAEPVPLSPFEVGNALRDGRIDGVAFPYEAVTSFDFLDEIVQIVEFPGGIYNATWFLGMNAATYDSLDDRDRAAIDSVERDILAEIAGKAWDIADFDGKAKCMTQRVEITRASDDMIAELKTAAGAAEANWQTEMATQGFDGGVALERFRKLTSASTL